MTLSAAHRPLNPPFRRANVRRDEVGAGICRGVFGTFCGQKVQSTPRAKTAVVLVPLQAIKCGGLKPASAGDGRILREHANIGEHPLFACSRVRPVKNRGLHCDWQLRAAGLASQARPVRLFWISVNDNHTTTHGRGWVFDYRGADFDITQ